MSNEKGYTYIELAIVLAIIAIISAVIMPSFKVLHRFELKQEAEIVRETIRYAQKLAMSENKEVRVEIKVDISGNNVIEVKSSILEKSVTLKNGVIFDFDILPVSIVKYDSKGIPAIVEENISEGIPKGISGVGEDIKLKNDYKISLDIDYITGRVELGEINN